MITFWKIIGNIIAFVVFSDVLGYVLNSIGDDKHFPTIFSKVLTYLIWTVGTLSVTYLIWKG